MSMARNIQALKMVSLLPFSAIFALVLIQNCATDEDSLESIQMGSNSKESLVLSNEEEEELKQEELDIISLCTDFLFSFNDVIHKFIQSSESQEDKEALKKSLDVLKPDIENLKKFTNQYANTVQTVDPAAAEVRDEMISEANSMIKALEKFSQQLSSETPMSKNEKAQFVQNDVRPAMKNFQKACFGETKDILKNVLVDVKQEESVKPDKIPAAKTDE